MHALTHALTLGFGLALMAPALAQEAGTAAPNDQAGTAAPDGEAGTAAPDGGAGASTTVRFINSNGDATGTGTFSATPAGVLINLDLNGLPASAWVAVHFHETGECDAAGGFESAGGHFNPGGHEHGYLAASGPHEGDLPNQRVDAEGRLYAQILAPAVTLGEGEADGDTNIRGRAFIVHDGDDDYESQPSGDAGGRFACAVIE